MQTQVPFTAVKFHSKNPLVLNHNSKFFASFKSENCFRHADSSLLAGSRVDRQTLEVRMMSGRAASDDTLRLKHYRVNLNISSSERIVFSSFRLEMLLIN